MKRLPKYFNLNAFRNNLKRLPMYSNLNALRNNLIVNHATSTNFDNYFFFKILIFVYNHLKRMQQKQSKYRLDLWTR